MSWFKQREVVTVLLEQLQKPKNWHLTDGEHRLVHKNGVGLWVSNGADFLTIDTPSIPARHQLTWWERRKLWPEVKKVVRRFQNETGDESIKNVIALLRK